MSEALAPANQGLSRFRMVLGRLGVGGWISAVLVLVLVLTAVLAPIFLTERALEQSLSNSYAPPSNEHLLGTDGLGRDILARTLVSTRLSLLLAAGSVLISMVIAIPIGAALGTGRPRVQKAGSTGIDISLSVPDILVAVVVVTVIGISGKGALLAVGLAFVPFLTRVTFVLASAAAQKDYVTAARVLGISRTRILFRYILTNIGDGLVVAVVALFGEAVVAVSALSFLGMGVQAPQMDLGGLLTTGVRDIYIAPYLALAPTVVIAVTGVALALLGDALAKALNPTVQGG